jgi:predicted nucleotidyltransferase
MLDDRGEEGVVQLQSPFAALSSGLDGDVLMVLSSLSDRPFTVSAIQRLVPGGRSRNGVKKVLDRLTEQGIVVFDDIGGVSTYALNRDHLLASAVLEVAGARTRFLDRVRGEIASMPVRYAALFGSAARGAMRPDSDIDLFFAVDAVSRTDAEDRIYDLTLAVHRWTGNQVNPIVYDVSGVSPDDPLIGSIASEGIPLVEDRRWLQAHLRKAAR